MLESIQDRFARDTAEHKMRVLHDDGLYRHLLFRASGHGFYWFELITAPNSLTFQGDVGAGYSFRRLPDMFEFFRSSAYLGQPNVDYWAEKLAAGRDAVMRYDEDLMRRCIEEDLADAIAEDSRNADDESERRLAGLRNAVSKELLDGLTGDESVDRQLVYDFRYWADDRERFREPADFEFANSWEWAIRDHDWAFVWACHAIVHAIGEYDRRPPRRGSYGWWRKVMSAR